MNNDRGKDFDRREAKKKALTNKTLVHTDEEEMRRRADALRESAFFLAYCLLKHSFLGGGEWEEPLKPSEGK